jgi:hypothetical protein
MSNEFENKPNIVLGLTTHGAIYFNNNGSNTQPKYEPIMFQVPEGMTITRVSIVYPGVANFVEPENIRSFNEQIKTMNTNFNKKDKNGNVIVPTPNKTIEIVNDMAEGLSKLDSKNFKMFDPSDYIEDDKTDQDALNYYYNQNKNYQIRQFKSGEFMINKFHNRLNKDRDESKGGDWSIEILNIPTEPYTDIDSGKTIQKIPDLLTKMRGMAAHTRIRDIETTTEEYITYLHSKGVRNVIVIDFTCSVFDLYEKTNFITRFSDRENIVSERATNHLARQIWDTTDFEKSPPLNVSYRKKRGGKTKNKRIKRRNNNTRRNYTRKNRN